MTNNVYIRFSDDIYADIDRGHSFYLDGKTKMDGLCAWTTSFFTDGRNFEDINGNEITLSDIEDYAVNILRNTYGSYSDNSEAHILTGVYAGNGNDGVLIKNVELIDSISI